MHLQPSQEFGLAMFLLTNLRRFAPSFQLLAFSWKSQIMKRANHSLQPTRTRYAGLVG